MQHVCCEVLGEIRNSRKKELLQTQLVLIDDDDTQTNTVFSYLHKPNIFRIDKSSGYDIKEKAEERLISKSIVESLNESILVTSAKAGLGKTYRVEQHAREK